MLKNRSLRFWITLSTLIALTPLAVSAVAGYALLNYGVIASFQDVAFRQQNQIIPAQRLRILIWEVMVPVDEFVEEGNPVHRAAYRTLRAQIETDFANLDETMKDELAVQALLQRARVEWTAADRYANELISVQMQRGDARATETMGRFHGELAAASDKLALVLDRIRRDIESDHAAASLFFERSVWLAGIAGAVSLLSVALGVFVIGRILAASVDRLVQGANRFAEGDRSHRIEVKLPPELHRVAEEFNHMIGRIHESEEILSDLAHRDGLTGLSNRRAFDGDLQEMWARAERFGEQCTLLAIDIDHFKRVNDTYGHAAGDDVLRVFAKTMIGNIRPFDRVYRVGGEEFAVLLPKTDSVAAREAAERLRRAIEATPICFKDTEIGVTISIGIASTLDVLEQSALVEAADAALYRAKIGGRNRIIMSRQKKAKDRAAA